jgi:hypothetical protein
MTTRYYRKLILENNKKTRAQNLKFRQWALKKAAQDEKWQEEFAIMSARDPLFFINTFVWTYDSRLAPKSTKIPFITFKEFQDDAILEVLCAILEHHDLLIEKSRDEGASWIILTCFEWLWQFQPGQSFLMGSRVEELVDKSENPKCLFWKVMYIIENQPGWLRPRYNKTHLHLYNKDTKSVIDGESTTGDFARGDRRTAILLDEFAMVAEGHGVLSASRDASTCRIFNSTPKGCGNAFYDMRQTDIRKLRFHWTKDPRKNQGLYTTTKDGEIEILDKGTCGNFSVKGKEYFYPDDYPFIKDTPGKLRSPWYDNECARAANPQEIAQELDINYHGSDFEFFWPAELDRIEREHVMTPLFVGEIHFETNCPADSKDYLKFKDLEERADGRLKLWLNPKPNGRINSEIEAVLGIDISMGTGASNSVIDITDRLTGEDIGEWVCPFTPPEELYKVAIGLAKYFNNAVIIWDRGGPGRIFGNKILQAGYRNIYYKTDENAVTPKVSDIPGYHFTPDNKLDTLGELRSAMASDEKIIHSKEFLNECRNYVLMLQSRTVEYAPAKSTIDPSGARENHGDRVIAKALSWKVCYQMPALQKEKEQDMPLSCLARRMQEYQKDQNKEEAWT